MAQTSNCIETIFIQQNINSKAKQNFAYNPSSNFIVSNDAAADDNWMGMRITHIHHWQAGDLFKTKRVMCFTLASKSTNQRPNMSQFSRTYAKEND